MRGTTDKFLPTENSNYLNKKTDISFFKKKTGFQSHVENEKISNLLIKIRETGDFGGI